MDFFPIFFDIKNKPCLVIGGGEVATRKAGMLMQSGGLITVVAPELTRTLKELADAGKITHVAEKFRPELLGEAVLVIAATNDRAANEQVSVAAKKLRIPVNVVDNPDLCSFIMPSVIDRSPLVIAISSGGTSPVLARVVRAKLEAFIPAAYGRLAHFAASFRDQVKDRILPAKRRIFWEKILQGPVAEMVLSGQDQTARDALQKMLAADSDDTPPRGEVYLVGGGPGNPDLLTFRALRLMQQADVVVYDNLVSPAVLELARRDAERIYVGKERAKHTMRQENINELLVKLAQEGKRVARLKGGDPFVFGRGGEEIETLAAHGIPFQVVPGITAATGVSSYAGIPLTHRDYAQSCVFVTGHLKDGSVNIDLTGIAKTNQTIVIYMGLLGLPTLCQELVAHGLPITTPAAIVQQGTTYQQKVVTGTLATLPELAVNAKMKPPTLIIVGEVVKLQDKLAWFKPEPIEGGSDFVQTTSD
ncbi:siroheme synthase CysG [Sulfuricella sp.]|uniref:siroheme synthase CysG n=1 Tax=Sulfuricella sp. TaxID=2099377 RepID=UPI002C3DDCF3|nr:siroheme synthase CysG [Sulfuricella sp.]HUX64916.1 siroheme synthase CysG [Sulfuricella sp.]